MSAAFESIPSSWLYCKCHVITAPLEVVFETMRNAGYWPLRIPEGWSAKPACSEVGLYVLPDGGATIRGMLVVTPALSADPPDLDDLSAWLNSLLANPEEERRDMGKMTCACGHTLWNRVFVEVQPHQTQPRNMITANAPLTFVPQVLAAMWQCARCGVVQEGPSQTVEAVEPSSEESIQS